MAETWTPAPREKPSLFDGDDHAVGMVDRASWIVELGRISPASIHSRSEEESHG